MEERIGNQRIMIESLVAHNDDRGSLFEVYRRDRSSVEMRQVYVSDSVPGAIRGNHYHERKTEGFLVLKGQAELQLVDVETGKGRTMLLRGADPMYVVLPPLIAHSLRACSKLMLLITTSEEYDEADPDTHVYDSF